jgi:hypothetical protein
LRITQHLSGGEGLPARSMMPDNEPGARRAPTDAAVLPVMKFLRVQNFTVSTNKDLNPQSAFNCIRPKLLEGKGRGRLFIERVWNFGASNSGKRTQNQQHPNMRTSRSSQTQRNSNISARCSGNGRCSGEGRVSAARSSRGRVSGRVSGSGQSQSARASGRTSGRCSEQNNPNANGNESSGEHNHEMKNLDLTESDHSSSDEDHYQTNAGQGQQPHSYPTKQARTTSLLQHVASDRKSMKHAFRWVRDSFEGNRPLRVQRRPEVDSDLLAVAELSALESRDLDSTPEDQLWRIVIVSLNQSGLLAHCSSLISNAG